MKRTRYSVLLSAVALLGTACSAARDTAEENPSAFSSNQATLLDFEFDGSLVTDQGFDEKGQVEAQMLFTIGHLNFNNSVARIDNMKVSEIKTEKVDDKLSRIKYHVRIPVAWGAKKDLPTSYKLTLPMRMDEAGQKALFAKVKDSCIEFGAHDPDLDSFFYYFRPNQSGCKMEAADILSTTASITRSTENTEGKFPEYDKVWEDKALKVVAVFGKFEDGKTTDSDAGIAGYNTFVAQVRSILGDGVKTTPATVPVKPGVGSPDVTFDVDIGDGRSVQVVALLVDNVRQAGPDFDKRYGELSTDADIIAYNGHAGLGSNVRALARKGTFKKGKYQIFFMNGCDTFAYVDGSLAQTRARLNPDDPTGTKYMEFVTNAMPSFFSSMPLASMALIKGLKNFEAPKTYDQIFKEIDDSEVVLVTGEEDNVFKP